MTDYTVRQEDHHAASIADEGAINAARSLADRECGAMQSEMREARKEYLATAFARHREQATAEIVAWLRREADHGTLDIEMSDAWDEAADAIERGDHHARQVLSDHVGEG